MKPLRAAAAWLVDEIDRRDVLGAVGLVLLTYGAEQIHTGSGFAIGGAIMVAIAVLVD